MSPVLEFGSYDDNSVALETILWYERHQAGSPEAAAWATRQLELLCAHIFRTAEEKSKCHLLPRVLQLLEARRFRDAQPPQTRTGAAFNAASGPAAELAPPYSWRKAVKLIIRAVEAFLRQAPVLWMGFLLVISVIVLNAVINVTLGWLHVNLPGVTTLLQVTDFLLIGIFCFEAISLLSITALREVHGKLRSLRKDDGGPRGPRPGLGPRVPRTPLPGAQSAFRLAAEKKWNQLEAEMASGRFVRDTVEMPAAVSDLGEMHERFDATSVNELPYWLEDLTNPSAQKYFQSCADLVRQGKTVTRALVLQDSQLEQTGILKDVVIRHLQAGIGIAIVPFSCLPASLQNRESNLDFGLWDHDNAYSVFRQHEGGYARNMNIVFSNAANFEEVREKTLLYRQIVANACLVDRVFLDSHRDLLAEILPQVRRNTGYLLSRLSRAWSGEVFMHTVQCEGDLDEYLRDLKQLTAAGSESR
jgi:hypothetical protein